MKLMSSITREKENNLMNNACLTTIIRKREQITSWEEIIAAIRSGKAREILGEGDQIALVLGEGSARERHMFVSVAKIKEDGIYCVTDDLVDYDVPMYKYIPNIPMMYKDIPNIPMSWSGSDARRYLNTNVLAMFPDVLMDNITPREITQRIAGKVIHTSDKLWIPSYTEFFGRNNGEAYPTDGVDEEQFSIFRTEQCRKKNYDGVIDWHWTRTLRFADSGGSTYFHNVDGYGNAYSFPANYRHGVCVGFCLGNP